jgi:hypothetical protein
VSAFAAYALGGDAEQRQQLRTLIDADLLVLDLCVARSYVESRRLAPA